MSRDSSKPSPSDVEDPQLQKLSLPSRLSPSRALDFQQCPQAFYYKAVEKRRDPANIHTARGTLIHDACERTFDLPKEERTPEAVIKIMGEIWPEMRVKDQYKHLFAEPPGDGSMPEGGDEDEFLATAEQLCRNWFEVERPWNFDPDDRERWLKTEVGGVPVIGVLDRATRWGEGNLAISDYKGLALDTLLPTPDGWTTMEDVQVGDTLFGVDGSPVEVTAKSGVHTRPGYRITFDDGAVITCDNVHLWEVVTGNDSWCKKLATSKYYRVVDADELYELWQTGAEGPIRVLVAEPVDTPEQEYSIDPYLLGIWLGDGRKRGGEISAGHVDIDHLTSQLELLGERFSVQATVEGRTADAVTILKPHADRCMWGHSYYKQGARARCQCDRDRFRGEPKPEATNQNLTQRLRTLDLLNNKHIPAEYLRGSIKQRTALLQGLMDSDGSWNTQRNRAVFVTTDEALADGMQQLLWSLGQKPYRWSKDYVTETTRQDRTFYQIWFTPVGINPFRLPRKAELVPDGLPESKARRRVVQNVEPVEEMRSACVAVDHPRHLYLAGQEMVPTHNTGKAPKPQYERKAFFGLRVYAALYRELTGETPTMLRLVHLKDPKVLTNPCNDKICDSTIRELGAIWKAINEAWRRNNWPTKTGPLCNWCSFQDICPAWNDDMSVEAEPGGQAA